VKSRTYQQLTELDTNVGCCYSVSQ